MSETTRKLNPSGSHAALITELTDTRRHLWTLIAESKKVMKHIPVALRDDFVKALIEAERSVS